MLSLTPSGTPHPQRILGHRLHPGPTRFSGKAEETPAKTEAPPADDKLEEQISTAYAKAKDAWFLKGRAYKKAADAVIKFLESKQEPKKATVTTIFLIVNDLIEKKFHNQTAQKITTMLMDSDEPRTAWRARHTAYRMRMDINEHVTARADKLLAKFTDGSAGDREKEDAALTSEFMLDQRISYPKALQLFSKGK